MDNLFKNKKRLWGSAAALLVVGGFLLVPDFGRNAYPYGYVAEASDSDVTPEEWFIFEKDTGTIIGFHPYGYEGNREIQIPSTIGGVDVNSIGDNTFYMHGIESVVIPYGVKSIGDAAFYWNPLKSIIIPGSVTSIGDYAFFRNNLESVIISESVTSIGDYAFSDIFDLQELKILSTELTIGVGAFGFRERGSVVEIRSSDAIAWVPDSDVKTQLRNSLFEGTIFLLNTEGPRNVLRELIAKAEDSPFSSISLENALDKAKDLVVSEDATVDDLKDAASEILNLLTYQKDLQSAREALVELIENARTLETDDMRLMDELAESIENAEIALEINELETIKDARDRLQEIHDIIVARNQIPNIENVHVEAYVTQQSGPTNDLTITLTLDFSNGASQQEVQTFTIANNADGTYQVGDFQVFVSTRGNTQIRQIFIEE